MLIIAIMLRILVNSDYQWLDHRHIRSKIGAMYTNLDTEDKLKRTYAFALLP
jgi:hypothetical protein